MLTTAERRRLRVDTPDGTPGRPGPPSGPPPPGTAPDSIQLGTWEWEGGHDSARTQKAPQ